MRASPRSKAQAHDVITLNIRRERDADALSDDLRPYCRVFKVARVIGVGEKLAHPIAVPVFQGGVALPLWHPSTGAFAQVIAGELPPGLTPAITVVVPSIGE